MGASAPAGAGVASGRADAVRVSVLRVLVAALGVALVVAAAWTPGALVQPVSPVLVPYSVLIWALYPTVAALVVAAAVALVRGVGLPLWAAAAILALATALWVSVGIGLPDGLPYGLLIGNGGAGAGAVLGSRRRLSVRVVGALVVVAVAVAALLVMMRA
jgi:hypothetical protein